MVNSARDAIILAKKTVAFNCSKELTLNVPQVEV